MPHKPLRSKDCILDSSKPAVPAGFLLKFHYKNKGSSGQSPEELSELAMLVQSRSRAARCWPILFPYRNSTSYRCCTGCRYFFKIAGNLLKQCTALFQPFGYFVHSFLTPKYLKRSFGASCCRTSTSLGRPARTRSAWKWKSALFHFARSTSLINKI